MFIQSMKGKRALSQRWCRHIAGVFKRDLSGYFKSCACCTSFKGQLSGKQKKKNKTKQLFQPLYWISI